MGAPLRRLVAGACATLVVLVSLPRADAQPSASDAAAARTLFDDARKLMKAGKYEEACPKLEEGVRLNPGIGMRYNLADCFEHLGKTASAWALYLDVAAAAKSKNDPKREKLARDAAKRLEAKLSRITIELGDGAEAIAGLEVKRDGAIVGPGQLGVAVPVDPGVHVVQATAPDHQTWTTDAKVEGDAASVTVKVPKLEPIAKAAPPPPPLPAPKHEGLDTTRTIALVVSAVGVVSLGVGTYFGLRALSLNSDSKAHCDGNLCDAEGYDQRTSARSAGTISTIAIAAGVVSIATGATLWLTAPTSAETKHARVSGWFAGTSGGMLLSGAF